MAGQKPEIPSPAPNHRRNWILLKMESVHYPRRVVQVRPVNVALCWGCCTRPAPEQKKNRILLKNQKMEPPNSIVSTVMETMPTVVLRLFSQEYECTSLGVIASKHSIGQT